MLTHQKQKSLFANKSKCVQKISIIKIIYCWKHYSLFTFAINEKKKQQQKISQIQKHQQQQHQQRENNFYPIEIFVVFFFRVYTRSERICLFIYCYKHFSICFRPNAPFGHFNINYSWFSFTFFYYFYIFFHFFFLFFFLFEWFFWTNLIGLKVKSQP